MTETARAVVARARSRCRTRDIVRAALMGARGNSGVILSQLVRGAVEALGDAAEVDAAALARALRGASDAGYAAVREPQEGTILTVARALAEKAEELVPADPPVEELLADARRARRGGARRNAPSSWTSSVKRAWSTRAGRACSRSCAGSRRTCAASRSLSSRRPRGRDPARGRAPGALPLPLLHHLLRGGGGGRPRGARAGADEARRLAPRGRRTGRGQGARPHGRARRGSRARDRARRRSKRSTSRTCTFRRRIAPSAWSGKRG